MTAGILTWQDLEAEAERIIGDVIGDFDRAEQGFSVRTLPQPPAPTKAPPRQGLRLPNLKELVLLSFAGTAASLAGVMWFSQLTQVWPGLTQPKEEPRVDPPAPPTPAEAEARVLQEYQTTLTQTKLALSNKGKVGPVDPFSAPFRTERNFRGRVTSLALNDASRNWSAPSRSVPKFIPPPTLTPPVPTPVPLQALPPLPTVATLPAQGAPAPVESLPTLVGVVGEGADRTALFQQGDNLKEFKAGQQLSSGWVVQEIQSGQTIMKKGGQTRTVTLGGI
ncbi:hypothetical protein [Anthocerotibacter panamensis]|uniref:hypothetical protein n=1 Tax=Anthocerotibacter panamensis TaxID=2857077 RepID=UPI001C4028F5|nr:hypothetical protein [Anthocerotibacter panamensis]